MEAVHRSGVHFILWLQHSLADHGEQMVSITRVGDPEFLILYIFPLISAINSNLFIRVILTTTLVDMLNNILKWCVRTHGPVSAQAASVFRFLHGERPYWWVYEVPDNAQLLRLRQFSVTCETGPGLSTSSILAIIPYLRISQVAPVDTPC